MRLSKKVLGAAFVVLLSVGSQRVVEEQGTHTAAWQKIKGPWNAECDGSFGAIAIHPKEPNVIYIGSSHPTKGCGIYKSIDGGKTWSPKNDGLHEIGLFEKHYPAITKIVVAPSDPNILYIGTYTENPILGPVGYIYRSADGGNRWVDARGKSNLFGVRQIQSGILDLAVAATNPNIVFAGLSVQGVYKTTDGGANWTEVKSASNPPVVDHYHIVRAIDSNTVYIAGGQTYSNVPCIPVPVQDGPISCSGSLPLGPFRSIDGGGNWININTPKRVFLTDFAIHPSNPNIVYFSTIAAGMVSPVPILIDNRGIFKSEDGGNNWRAINDASNIDLSSIPIYDIEIDPSSPEVVYAASGFNGIFRSINGGNSWELIEGPQGVAFIAKIYAGPGKLYALTNDGLFVLSLVPTEILSPVAGDLEIVYPGQQYSGTKWCFNQHQEQPGGPGTPGHGPGGGIGKADDTFAWDVNLNYPAWNSDAGEPVYAVARGVVPDAYGGSINAGGSYGQILIEHIYQGNKWWSGYLHLRDIQVMPGQNVDENTILGYISNVGADNDHLHFVVYKGQNIQGGLVSFDVNIIPRIVEPPPPVLDILKPTQSAPSLAGPKDNPTKIEVKVQILARTIHALNRGDFEVLIGQRAANVLTVAELDSFYVLEVMPPVQDEDGLYDLTVNIPSLSLSDTEIEAVQYSEAMNVDVVLVIDRSGSMSGDKIEDAKNAAKQFVDLMNEGDQVAVVSFNEEARVDFPLTLIAPISPGAVIFSDDMESGTANWTADPPWGQITTDSHSPITCWTDSPGRDYANNGDYSLTSTSIAIPAGENAYLSFWHHYELESGYDYGRVEISTDGGSTWAVLASYTGNQYIWEQSLIDLTSYAGATIEIRFRLITDSSVTDDGWYIDDVEIRKGAPPVNVKEQAKAAITSLSAGGFTSIGDGLQFGQDQLTSSGTPEHAWAIVLLSDGLENEPAYVADVLPTIPDKTDVYAIALGTDADEALMQDIATETGGQYYFSPSSQELQEIYNLIRGAVIGEEIIASKSGTVIEGETEREPVQIDPTVSQATFGVSWSGSDIDLTLTDPSGANIDPTSAAADTNISFVSTPTYEYYTIVSPTPGEWKLNIIGVDTPLGGEDYTARVTGQTELTLEAYFDKDQYEAGQPVTVLVSLSDGSGPITGATIEVTVQAPLLGLSAWRGVNGDLAPTGPLRRSIADLKSLQKESSNPPVFHLYDDGSHGDGRAKDGVYANLYTDTFNSGSYIFNFDVSGKTSTGHPFSRITQRSLFVAPVTSTGSISGNVSYRGWQNGTIYIQAWRDDPSMYGNPDYLTSISSAGPYVLPNLPDGTYYVLSYMDINGNGSEDPGEPFGIYGSPDPVVVSSGGEATGVDMTLTLPAIVVYPNPCYPNKGQDEVKIANLPSQDSKVYIYTISGELVRTLDDETEIIGAIATWDLKNDDGEKVARGVYIYIVSDKNDNKKIGKIAIIK